MSFPHLQLSFCIFECSMLHMYQTYVRLENYIGKRMRILYIDTDAFIPHIKSDDLFLELKLKPKLHDRMDFLMIPAAPPSGIGDRNDPSDTVVDFFKD